MKDLKFLCGESLLVKKQATPDNFEVPVWTSLDQRWYQKLNRIARRLQLTRAEVLDQALTYFDGLKNKHGAKKVNLKSEESVRKFFGGMSKSWWDSLTPEEREVERQKRVDAINARWEKYYKEHPEKKPRNRPKK